MDEVSAAMMAIKHRRKYLTRHQIRTIEGQILSGNISGAMKGMDKILAQKGVVLSGPLRQDEEKR